MDTWTSIEQGRAALGDYLAGLAPEDWNRPTMSGTWTVKDVAAHLLVIPTKSKGQVFRAFVASRFDLDRLNGTFVRKLTADLTTAQIASTMRSSARSHSRPPGLKLPGVLNELAIHAADISEAVGTPFDLPTDVYVACLDHLKATQPVFGTKQRIDGLQLRATDATWSHGSGPLVSGPAKQLLLAVSGRPAALDHLTGEGIATLRART